MDILAAARRYRMFQPSDLVVAAVSGGPDSVAMLHALHTHSEDLGISLHVAHLNHGIRGANSDADQEFVSKLAQQFGLPFTTERVDVPRLRVEMRMGEEEAARVLRYKFLQETCTKLDAQRVAVAHNANDRAESVLLNILRGTGTAGLGSIRPIRGNIVRPLIETSREDILTYVEQNGLPFALDESNMDTSYSRNRIRHDLIPLLQEGYNPRIIDALNRLADIALPEDDYLTQATASAIRSLAMRDGLDAGLIPGLPLALQRRVLRAEIERCRGNLQDLTLEQVDRVLDALRTGADFSITLPSGSLFAVRKGDIFAVRPMERFDTVNYERLLSVPGITELPESGIVIEAKMVCDAVPARLPSNQVMIDARAISGPLRVRSPRLGDRIVPFGMTHSKKLQDVFVDKKIHRRDRVKATVIEDNEQILWVAGVIASEATRITNTAPEAIRLTCDPLEDKTAR